MYKRPAMHAFMNDEKFPASIARDAYFINTFALDGANTLKVAISMPMVPKLANPQRAYVDITIDLSSQIIFVMLPGNGNVPFLIKRLKT